MNIQRRTISLSIALATGTFCRAAETQADFYVATSRGRERARMKDIETVYNIYFCKADNSQGEKILQGLQRRGIDTNSVAVDPMFVDPENGDFRFHPDSPALKLGIVPFDMSKDGLRSDKQ